MADIEILGFRSDEPASKGITAAHVDDVIAGYNADVQPAPIVIGHPSTDAPAHGVIKSLRREGNNLFVTLKDLGKEVIDGVKQSKLVSRSIAFWDPHHPSNPTPGKYALRHFGFLGAQAPGIPNLGKLSFSADDDDTSLVAEGEPAPAVVYEFSAAPTPVATITETPAPAKPAAPKQEFNAVKTEAELAAEAEANRIERENLAAERAQFAAERKTAREKHNATLVAALVAGGQLNPADKDALTVAFNAIDVPPVEFAANDTGNVVDRIAAIFGKAGKVTPGATDQQLSPTDTPPAQFSAPDATASKEAADKALAAANTNLGSAWKGK